MQSIDLINILSEINITAIIALILIVIIVYKDVFVNFFKRNNDTNNEYNSLNNIDYSDDLNNINEKLDELMEKVSTNKDINNTELMIISHMKELKLLISDLKIKLTENDNHYLNIDHKLNMIENKLDRMIKIITKYLEIDID